MSNTPISPLRRRMIEDMSLRKFGEKTQYDYIGYVKTFSTFLGRSPATATPEDLRQYQVHQSQAGVSAATINSSVAALRFFFRVTLNHPEMGRHLTLVPLPERLRVVLSEEEVAQLLEAAPSAEIFCLVPLTAVSSCNKCPQTRRCWIALEVGLVTTGFPVESL